MTLSNVKKIIQESVEAMYNSTLTGSTKGWWVFLGNHEISKNMPYQAYEQLQGVVSNLERTVEKPLKNYKKIRFLEGDCMAQPGYISELGRSINGLDTNWKIKLIDYRPNPKAVLWEIFPEYYSEPQ